MSRNNFRITKQNANPIPSDRAGEPVYAGCRRRSPVSAPHAPSSRSVLSFSAAQITSALIPLGRFTQCSCRRSCRRNIRLHDKFGQTDDLLFQIKHVDVQRDDFVTMRAMTDCLDRRAAYDVVQFVGISGPRIMVQCLLCGSRQAQSSQTQTGTVDFEKTAGQQQDIVATLPQGLYRNRIKR